jgi:hypothetical protein
MSQDIPLALRIQTTPSAQDVETRLRREMLRVGLASSHIPRKAGGEITPGEAEEGSLRHELPSSASRGLPRFRRAMRRCGTCRSRPQLVATRVRSRCFSLPCKAERVKVASPAVSALRSSLLHPRRLDHCCRRLDPCCDRDFPRPEDAKPQRSPRNMPTGMAWSVRSSSQSISSSAKARLSG